MKKKHLAYFIGLSLLQLGANMAHPVTPMFIATRGLTSSMFGYALAGAMFTQFLVAPLYGKLCNYIPTKRLMCIGGLGYALGQFFFFLAHSDLTMLLARLFTGLFIGCVYTGCLNYLVNTSEDAAARGKNLTIYATIYTVVSALGFFLGGMLGEITIETALISQVIMLASSGTVFGIFCVDDTPYKHRPEKPLRVRDINPLQSFFDLKHYASRILVMIFVIVAVTYIGQSTFEQVFNYYIMDHFGLTSRYNGIFKAMIAIVSFAVNLTVSMRLIRKTDTNRTILPIVLCSTIPLGLILLFDSIVPFVIMDVTFYAFTAIRTPLLQDLVSRNADTEYSNNAMGFYQSMNSLGTLFGALFAGLLYAADIRLPFVFAFGAFVIASAVTVFYVHLYRSRKKGGTA